MFIEYYMWCVPRTLFCHSLLDSAGVAIRWSLIDFQRKKSSFAGDRDDEDSLAYFKNLNICKIIGIGN